MVRFQMRIIRPSSEDEMVLAFLKRRLIRITGEGIIERALRARGYSRTIIDIPDFEDSGKNLARAYSLSCSRGFRIDDYLFRVPRQRHLAKDRSLY